MDGPFASYNLSVGPGTTATNHCLTRSFNIWAPPFVNSSQVANTTRQPTFELFRIELEGTPVTPDFKIHDGGHLTVGGEMNDRYSSPGGTFLIILRVSPPKTKLTYHYSACLYLDPLFYLHHANLDRIWWQWQQKNPAKRLKEISGRSTVAPPYKNVTLEFPLKMGSLAPLLTIGDVMDTRDLCYTYLV